MESSVQEFSKILAGSHKFPNMKCGKQEISCFTARKIKNNQLSAISWQFNQIPNHWVEIIDWIIRKTFQQKKKSTLRSFQNLQLLHTTPVEKFLKFCKNFAKTSKTPCKILQKFCEFLRFFCKVSITTPNFLESVSI